MCEIPSKLPTMSYNYLRYSRLPSQRMVPPSLPGSIDALLDPRSRDSHQLFKTQVLNNSQAGNAIDNEPLPSLDYHLLHLLINLTRPCLNGRDLKRYDYLAEGRRWYFIGLSKFQDAFMELQAASTHGKILAARFDELAQKLRGSISSAKNPSALASNSASALDHEQYINKLQCEMATIELARRRNNEDLRQILLLVERRAKARDKATAWFSSLKWKFLQTEVPALVDMVKQIYAYHMGKQGTSHPADPFSPSFPSLTNFLHLAAEKPRAPDLPPVMEISSLTSRLLDLEDGENERPTNGVPA